MWLAWPFHCRCGVGAQDGHLPCPAPGLWLRSPGPCPGPRSRPAACPGPTRPASPLLRAEAMLPVLDAGDGRADGDEAPDATVAHDPLLRSLIAGARSAAVRQEFLRLPAENYTADHDVKILVRGPRRGDWPPRGRGGVQGGGARGGTLLAPPGVALFPRSLAPFSRQSFCRPTRLRRAITDGDVQREWPEPTPGHGPYRMARGGSARRRRGRCAAGGL